MTRFSTARTKAPIWWPRRIASAATKRPMNPLAPVTGNFTLDYCSEAAPADIRWGPAPRQAGHTARQRPERQLEPRMKPFSVARRAVQHETAGAHDG